MFLEMVRSEGLSHLSCMLGDGGEAAVIDPRRDTERYFDIVQREGVRITHVFETHRNEDYVVDSREVARHTGARIYHGSQLPLRYGTAVTEGESFRIGALKLQVLDTPGHTLESISITLADTGFSDDPVAVFTGDTLFVGEVGRTDFYPDRAQEVAGLLYDSTFHKLLPLGDQVIVCQAHGTGSVKIPSVYAGRLPRRVDSAADFTLLDVRSRGEFEAGHLPDSTSGYADELPLRLSEMRRERPVTTFCGSGQRAVIATSILRNAGFEGAEVCLGSMQACEKLGRPVIPRK
jgi:glyoxylase-like metal-dependent hydrolase (beta-lactamase superfamily II)